MKCVLLLLVTLHLYDVFEATPAVSGAWCPRCSTSQTEKAPFDSLLPVLRKKRAIYRTWGLSSGYGGSSFGSRGSPSGDRGSRSGIRGSPSGIRGSPSAYRGSPSAYRGSSYGSRGSPSGFRGSRSGIRGSPSGFRGSRSGIRWSPSGIRGSSYGVRGPSSGSRRGRFSMGSQTIVFRNLRPDEYPERGLVAQAPLATYTMTQHVENGRWRTQYISATKRFDVAVRFHRNQNRVVCIGVEKAMQAGAVYHDISLGQGLDSARARGYAVSSAEVLFTGRIPAVALVLVPETMVRGNMGRNVRDHCLEQLRYRATG